eukprot:5792111-Pyramimonas_sp.AAC.1
MHGKWTSERRRESGAPQGPPRASNFDRNFARRHVRPNIACCWIPVGLNALLEPSWAPPGAPA